MIDLAINPEWLEHASVDMAALHGSGGVGMTITADGVGVIDINGPMSKAGGWFSGTSTIEARNALYAAVGDPDVKAIMLHIDSPGGTVAGTHELAEDIRQAGTVKPVHAHIDDMGASAALWAATQAGTVTANSMAQIGSIGVYAVVADLSAAAEQAGIKFHVISTGAYKGAGVAGAPVTEDQLAHVRERVERVNDVFVGSVAQGRGMSVDKVRELADGRTHIAADAKRYGLIDEVMSFRDALHMAAESVSTPRRDAMAARVRDSRLRGA